MIKPLLQQPYTLSDEADEAGVLGAGPAQLPALSGAGTHPQQIAYPSTAMTLEPGDVTITGMPSNVGIATQTFLKPGDVVRVEDK